MTTTGRRGRLFSRGEDDPDDRGADLSEDEHAWWAAREGVAGVPHGTNPRPVDEQPEPKSEYARTWTTESLFERRARQRPPRATPPPDDPSAAGVPVPGGMDLDSAYLVLQIAIGVDWEEITSAHRRLAKLYHPDRLVTYSVDAQAMGRERMAQINAAHATLRALHFKR